MKNATKRVHRRHLIIGAAVAAVLTVAVVALNTGGPSSPSMKPTPNTELIAPSAPGPVATSTPSPISTEDTSITGAIPTAAPDEAVHMPVAPQMPDGNTDPEAARTESENAAMSAVLGSIYYDSIEPPQRRAQRLSVLFAPGSDAVQDDPLLTAENASQNVVTEGTITYVLPIEVNATSATYTVSVEWRSAEWDNNGGPLRTLGGQVDVVTTVQHLDGAWIATSVDQT